MSCGDIHVNELDRMIPIPCPPESYSAPGKAAFRRGVRDRCWRAESACSYRRRYMRHAWMAGWDAANVAIMAAQQVTS